MADLSPIERVKLSKQVVEISKQITEETGKASPNRVMLAKLAKQRVELRVKLGAAAPAPARAAEPAKFGMEKGEGKVTRETINAKVGEIVDLLDAGAISPGKLTEEQLDLMRKYSGKGGLDDNSQFEYFTPPHIAEGAWDILKQNGFANGNVLEPSTGAGVFSATKPAGSIITGAEISKISATVNQILHPEDKILNEPFEAMVVRTPDDTFDAVIGNVPFGDRGKEAVIDKEMKGEKRIELYFIKRVIRKVRAGGLITLVVPTSIVSGKKLNKFRAEISMMAEFLGAHKLPSKTFARQGTDVVTDIIVLRKHSADVADKIKDVGPDVLREANVLWDEFITGKYWLGEGKKFIHGQYVPPNPDDVRPMEKVIGDDNMTPEALKKRLAVKFESRIDYAMLDSAPTAIEYYDEGAIRTINGQTMRLENGQWVAYQPEGEEDTLLDASIYGVGSLEELKALVTSPSGMLNITSAQAFKIYKKYPALLSEAQITAINFSIMQPQEKYRELAYRGSLLGYMVKTYAVGNDATDRDRVIDLLKREFERNGHPSTLKGLEVNSERAKDFGHFISAIDKDGNVSAVVSGTQKKVTGYASDDIESIVSHLSRIGNDEIDIDAIAKLYTGPRKLLTMGDIADISGIAIMPNGYVDVIHEYLRGDAFEKIGDLQSAISGSDDLRLSQHWQELIEKLMRKLKPVNIGEVSFGLRDNWIKPEYRLEFLKSSGYDDIGYFAGEVDAEEDGSAIQLDEESFGVWRWAGKGGGFGSQLAKYMNGKSINHGVTGGKGEDAKIRKAEKVSENQTQINGLEERFRAYMQSHPDSIDIMQDYNMRFNRFIEPDYSKEDLGLQGVSTLVKTHWYQNQGVRRLSENGFGILGHDVGLGKAQPLDAKILTPKGWVLMGEIKVGDMVIAVDGTAVPVTGVFPQGDKEIYEVEFSDGAKTKCCDEHLWMTKTELDMRRERDGKRKGSSGYQAHGSVKPLRKIIDTLTVGKKQKNHRIPMVLPVEFERKNLEVDPYLLGVLLGDGCFRGHTITITNPDNQIFDNVENSIGDLHKDLKLSVHDTGVGACLTYGITRSSKSGENSLIESLRKFGLMGKYSHEKFIPEEYLFSSIEQRHLLLCGLMDTDGYVSKDGMTVKYSSSSKELADGVAFLVMSFGGSAWITSKIPTYTHNNERREGLLSYTVNMRLPYFVNPFMLERKASRIKPKTKYQPVRLFERVSLVGVEPAQCISIDHPSRLYVTDDFVVTHNTYQALAFSMYDRQMGRSKKHCIVVPKPVLQNWYNESKAFLGNHNNVLFVGFRPKMDKAGVIMQEPILDENGKQKTGLIDGVESPLFQDILVEEKGALLFEKMAAIPAMDTGMVIMTKEHFKAIPVKPDTIDSYVAQMSERSMVSNANAKGMMVAAAGKSDKETKGMSYAQVQALANMEYQAATGTGEKKDQYPYFEDMNFDRVIVDEAHHFKSPYDIKGMDKMAYLSNPTPSQRAQDLALKLEHVKGKNGGRGPILLTATPVSNSPIEIYNMLAYLVDRKELDRMGIYTPDDFVRFFGVIDSVDKLTVSGNLEQRDGLKGFRNLNILRGLFNRYADMKNAKDVDPNGDVLKLPDAVKINSEADMTDEQIGLYQSLREEAKLAGNPKNVRNGLARPMFAVMRDMERVTTDIDLFHRQQTFVFKLEDEQKVVQLIADMPQRIEAVIVDEDAQAENEQAMDAAGDKAEKVKVYLEKVMDFERKGSMIIYKCPEQWEQYIVDRLKPFGISFVSHPMTPKYKKLVDNLKAEVAANERAKQLIFTEEKSQHGKLSRLVSASMPIDSKKIAIINADTAGGEKLQGIVDAYTRSDNTVVIANKKAEVGINLNKGTTAIHHLTLPWNPASIQQRNGRGVRQGNKSAYVNLYYYMAKGSFDEYRLDLLEKKSGWINALLDKNNTADTHDNENAMGDFEQQALLSDNKEEFLAKIAEQQAKKEAELKAKRDAKAKTDLVQLMNARKYLETFDDKKAADLVRVQHEKDLADRSLQEAVENDTGDQESKLVISRRTARAKKAARDLENFEASWAAKKKDAEIKVRLNTSTLQGLAAKGQLPFSESLVNAKDVLMTMNRTMLYDGGMYQTGTSIFKIETVSVDDGAKVRVLAGGRPYNYRQMNSDGEVSLEVLQRDNSIQEVHYNEQEIILQEKLANEYDYKSLEKAFTKDEFLKYQPQIKLGSYTYAIYNAGTGVKVERAITGNLDIVYPDSSDKSLKDKLAKLYGADLQAEAETRKYAYVMPAIFGYDWQNAIIEYLKILKAEEMLGIGKRLFDEAMKEQVDFELKTSADYRRARWLVDAAGNQAALNLRTYMVDNGYVNMKNIESVMNSVEVTAVNELQKREEELRLLESSRAEKERQEQYRSNPNFRELTFEQKKRFSAMNMEAKYNYETEGKYRAFEHLFIHDNAGFNGILKSKKDILKARFSSKWYPKKDAGMDKFEMGDSWVFRADTSVEEILDLLE